MPHQQLHHEKAHLLSSENPNTDVRLGLPLLYQGQPSHSKIQMIELDFIYAAIQMVISLTHTRS